MRVLLCILCTAFIGCSVAMAQPDTLWSCVVEFGTPGPMINGGMILANGDYLIVGVNNPEYTNMNMFVARVSSVGVVQWTRQFGQQAWNEQANSVTELGDGTIVLAGYGGVGSDYTYIVLIGVSANGDSLWYRSFYGGGMAKGNDICVLSNGNMAVCGYRLGADGVHSDAWILYCNPAGDTINTRTYGGSDTDIAAKIRQDHDGNLIVGGYTKSWGAGDYDIWVLRIDGANGSQLSSQAFGTTGQEFCYGILFNDSLVYLGGRSQAGSDNNGYIVKADAAGSGIWALPFTNGLAEEQIRGIEFHSDGSLMGVGWSGSTSTNVAPWVLTAGSDGSHLASYVFSSLPQGRFYGVLKAPAPSVGFLAYGIIVQSSIRKGYLLRIAPPQGFTGTVRRFDNHEPIAGARVQIPGTSRIVTTNTLGRFVMDVPYGTYDMVASCRCYAPDTLFNVEAYPDSTVDVEFILGVPKYTQTRSSVNIIVHNRMVNRDSFYVYNSGDSPLSIWTTTQTLNPPTNWLRSEPASGVIQPQDSGKIVLIISPDTTDDGVYDYFGHLTIRNNSCPDSLDQLPVLVSVLDVDDGIPSAVREYALDPAYPNPFNPSTTLRFSLPNETLVRLSIYDITGREVRTLTEMRYPVGTHSLTFDAGDLPSGLYIARMNSREFSATQKLLLLK